MAPLTTDSQALKRLLIADSDDRSRQIVCTFLSRYFKVDAAADADEAMQILQKDHSYDLVVADTRLTPNNGFKFIANATQAYPELQSALMTSDRIDEYIPALRKLHIHNVLVKTSPFQFDEFLIAIENLLYPARCLGLRRYFREPMQIRQSRVLTKGDKTAVTDEALGYFRRYRQYDTEVGEIRLAFEELLNNALFHAFRKQDGGEKYRADTFTAFEPNEFIDVEYGRDKTYLGFSITDNQGTLDADTCLAKMERQISMEGLFDENGRGLYLTRTLGERMIINLKPGKSTQIILLIAHHKNSFPKPLLINEIRNSL